MKNILIFTLLLGINSICAATTNWQPIMNKGASFVPADYQLVFNDEFNGTQLNRAKWLTRYQYGTDYLKDEQQRYKDNNNHIMHDGMLSLTARKTPYGYESGMIRSIWETHYGYYEASIRMPNGKGSFPAFWLNAGLGWDNRQEWSSNEIDIVEFVINSTGDNSGAFKDMLHSNVVATPASPSYLEYANPKYNLQWHNYNTGVDLTKKFHTYGLKWEEGMVTMYFDGIAIYKRTYNWLYTSDMTQAGPAHIIMNYAIGGSWAGRDGIDDSKFPQSLDIDWIRVYKKISP